MDYLIHVLVLACIYVIVGTAVNLVSGYAGLISLTHAGFYGMGAYTAGLLSIHTGVNIETTLPAAALIGLCAGIIIGMLSLRVGGDYFIIVTFAFQIVLFSIMNNWTQLSRGALGLSGIPHPRLFEIPISSQPGFFTVYLAATLLVLVFVARIVRSPYGNTIRAIRDDEMLVASLGRHPGKKKLSIFAVSASITAVAGALYAHYVTFIDPTSFTAQESIFMLSIVVVGGAGSLVGPVFGVLLLIAVPELLRLSHAGGHYAPNVRQILLGSALIICMMWRPQGIRGRFDFKTNGR